VVEVGKRHCRVRLFCYVGKRHCRVRRGEYGHGNLIFGAGNMDTAVPFPYREYGYGSAVSHKKYGHGSAVSLPGIWTRQCHFWRGEYGHGNLIFGAGNMDTVIPFTTRNMDTAVPFPYGKYGRDNLIFGAGNMDTAMSFLAREIWTRQCRFPQEIWTRQCRFPTGNMDATI